MVLTVYAIRASALAFDQLMRDTLKDQKRHLRSRRTRDPSRKRTVGSNLAVRALEFAGMNAPKVITSLTNDRIKAIRALEMRKVRKETGLFVAEGASLLITARDHGFVPETLVYQAGTNDSWHRARVDRLGAERRR